MIEQELARRTLKIILDNEMKIKLDFDFIGKVRSISKFKGEFTPEQLSYIDGLYERYMKAGGFPSVPLKHDYKR